jgi:aryl-alcohol dehydrogenase-like predicted oxidoreductase
VNIADQEALELVLPAAEKAGIGVIAKRPLANVVWHHSDRSPRDSYGRVYWDRLQKLKYDFLRRSPPETVSIALRFTLGVPGVHTAIVGTIQPERFAENASIAAAGRLPEPQFDSIRARWLEIARPSWVGQS